MRTVLVDAFGPIENTRLGEIADPVPGPGEVLVEIHATAVNFVDLLLIGGMHQSKPALPYIPGKGPAGIIRAIGAGVTGFAPGDRVLAMCEPGGGFAEMIALPASQTHKIPDSLSFQDAASMALIFDTAWFALRERAHFSAGESVLILGASGGVGLAAIQLVNAMGGRTLAAIANPDKADMVREAGADEIIDLNRENIRDDLRDQVYAVTDGKGVDIVIDPIGDRYFDAALRALAWCGRLVVIGFAAGDIGTVKANYLLVRNITVTGLQIGDYRKRAPEKTARCFDEIGELYEQGKITPPPTTILPITDIQDALGALKDRSIRGRIVVTQDR